MLKDVTQYIFLLKKINIALTKSSMSYFRRFFHLSSDTDCKGINTSDFIKSSQ